MVRGGNGELYQTHKKKNINLLKYQFLLLLLLLYLCVFLFIFYFFFLIFLVLFTRLFGPSFISAVSSETDRAV